MKKMFSRSHRLLNLDLIQGLSSVGHLERFPQGRNVSILMIFSWRVGMETKILSAWEYFLGNLARGLFFRIR